MDNLPESNEHIPETATNKVDADVNRKLLSLLDEYTALCDTLRNDKNAAGRKLAGIVMGSHELAKMLDINIEAELKTAMMETKSKSDQVVQEEVVV